MTFEDWAHETATRIRRDGFEGGTESLYKLYIGALRRLGQTYNFGDSIYDREWDVLIVLDACRPDLLHEVTEEYKFLKTPNTVTSNASSSEEWLEKNFVARPKDAQDTVYVTGNPFSQQQLSSDDFFVLDEVWQYAWDADEGTVQPNALTDRAIYHRRQHSNRRMVVHYMQPHYPFISSNLSYSLDVNSFGTGNGRSVWEDLRRGDVAKDDVWEGYRTNLKYVLDSVEKLLDNLDGEMIAITADHANALGEWGVYGHPAYVPINAIKRVPWVVTTATDSDVYEPTIEPDEKRVNDSVESRLKDLGYT